MPKYRRDATREAAGTRAKTSAVALAPAATAGEGARTTRAITIMMRAWSLGGTNQSREETGVPSGINRLLR